MAGKKEGTLSRFLADRFAPEWKLLSETESFLSHTPEFGAYEAQFRQWRKQLQDAKTREDALRTVREEIVALRRELRGRGYDLSLGSTRLVIDGFRNDDSLAEGFRRVVICICGPRVYWQTGQANHVEISGELMDTLSRKRLLDHPEVHYLWYLRTRRELVLSGSATETREAFLRLEARAEANPLMLLSALKDLS